MVVYFLLFFDFQFMSKFAMQLFMKINLRIDLVSDYRYRHIKFYIRDRDSTYYHCFLIFSLRHGLIMFEVLRYSLIVSEY